MRVFLWLLYSIIALCAKDDFYSILGLDRNTFTKQACKKAYRKLSKEYHPDKNSGEEAEEMFVKISHGTK